MSASWPSLKEKEKKREKRKSGKKNAMRESTWSLAQMHDTDYSLVSFSRAKKTRRHLSILRQLTTPYTHHTHSTPYVADISP